MMYRHCAICMHRLSNQVCEDVQPIGAELMQKSNRPVA